jgi:hypothetical protein
LPNSNFNDLLSIFAAHNVRYLIVGGYALMLYCEPRFTKDLDIWVEPGESNAKAVFAALREFGAPLSGMTPADFAAVGTFYQIGVAPIRIDILMSIDGVEFEPAWAAREQRPFGGQLTNFISRADLIRNKRASGRLQDLADVERLLEGAEET